MGWFWGKSQEDPVKKLDPGLREFLEQETPDKYEPVSNLKQPASSPTQPPTQAQIPEQTEEKDFKLPAASLYQDGRYAHLWKTYKPLAEQEEEDAAIGGANRVIEKFKERGDTVQRAAMENCALEHEALTLCFQTGNWRKQIEARLTNCAAENGTFSRCFTTQSVSEHIRSISSCS